MRKTVPKKEWAPYVLIVVALTAVTMASLLPLFLGEGAGATTATATESNPVVVPAKPVFVMVKQSLEDEENEG